MRVLINGLSATSFSGRHVLLGHLGQLARWQPNCHEFFVLFHPSNSELRRDSHTNVHWIEVPDGVRHWKQRTVWEIFSLRKLIRETRADLLFTPSGTVVPGCPLPQISLGQNPWCLIRDLHRGPRDQIKAFFQRRAYRYAVAHAALMAYNSEFMRRAYQMNSGHIGERDNIIAYQGLDDDTHTAASQMRHGVSIQRHRILAVSVMAPWKNIETLVDAFSLLRRRALPATLCLVGPWADKDYEHSIRRQIDRLGLSAHVQITGSVSRLELYRHYAEATVFCLLSRCESFGIPALESQLFGTPAVISDCCAMPEICGEGAVSVPPDDPGRAAEALALLLEDSRHRQHLADAAVENASRFRWSECSRPLFRIFDFPSRGST